MSLSPFSPALDIQIQRLHRPELASQANLTVQEGVDLWKTYVEPLRASGYRLGSPGPSSSPAGKVWLQDFIEACNGDCTIDFISTRKDQFFSIRAVADTIEPLKQTGMVQMQLFSSSTLRDYYNTFQKPLWITEWACQDYVNTSHICTADEVSAFLNVTQIYLDSASYVERYAWFGAQRDLSIVNIVRPIFVLFLFSRSFIFFILRTTQSSTTTALLISLESNTSTILTLMVPSIQRFRRSPPLYHLLQAPPAMVLGITSLPSFA